MLNVIRHHWHAFLTGGSQLIKAPLTTIITLIVIGIAIALPTGMLIMLQNIQHISQGWQKSVAISLYLKKDIPNQQIQITLQQLQRRSDIQSAKYISPEQGLATFSKQSEFGDVLSTLENNPLPGVIVIHPKTTAQTPQKIHALLSALQQLNIVDQSKFDMAWVKRLYAIMQLGQHVLYALAFLIGLGVIFIIGNTIYLATQHYRKEMEIYKLTGATDSFVRRPFLYSGFWYGLTGSGFAWLLINSMLWWLKQPVDHLAALYSSHFLLYGLSANQSIVLLFVGVALGLIGSWFAVNRQLSQVLH